MIQTEATGDAMTEKSGTILNGVLQSVDFEPDDYPNQYLITISVQADPRLKFGPCNARLWLGDFSDEPKSTGSE